MQCAVGGVLWMVCSGPAGVANNSAVRSSGMEGNEVTGVGGQGLVISMAGSNNQGAASHRASPLKRKKKHKKMHFEVAVS